MTRPRFDPKDFPRGEGILTPEAANYLLGVMVHGGTLVIAGTTGSGKTFVGQRILQEMLDYYPRGAIRLFIVEDSNEIILNGWNGDGKFDTGNIVYTVTRPEIRGGPPPVTMYDLIRAALRSRPHGVVIGEARGAEAWELIRAAATGHGHSAFTIHATHDRLTTLGKALTRDRRALAHDLDGTEPAPHSPEATTCLDDRHLGQLRCDLALDLLLTGTPTGHDIHDTIRATVEITIPVTTLTGLDDGPALLAGHGPIDPDTARRLAANTTGWERLFLHPDTRALLTIDHYTPTAAQRRYLHARDKTCRVPGCDIKATHCDLDHTVPYSTGGVTDVENLNCLCEQHHMLKHHAPWRWHNLGHGRTRITSPCGYDYTEGPPLIYTGGGSPPPF